MANDYPYSDFTLSWRWQQLTSLKVDPDRRVLKLTNPSLSEHPFSYAVKPGWMDLRETEVPPEHAVVHGVFHLKKDQLQVRPIYFYERTGSSSRNGEGENDDYFHKFSETRADPLAINIVFDVMTH